MKKLITTIILLLALALPDFATNWVELGDSYYIDIDSIAHIEDYYFQNKNLYRYWYWAPCTVMCDFLEEKVSHYVREFAVDCSNNNLMFLTAYAYSSNNNIIKTYREPRAYNPLNFESLPPNSMGQYMANFVCSYVKSQDK